MKIICLNSQILVAPTGVAPARPQWARDFKSLVSTDSTIGPLPICFIISKNFHNTNITKIFEISK